MKNRNSRSSIRTMRMGAALLLLASTAILRGGQNQWTTGGPPGNLFSGVVVSGRNPRTVFAAGDMSTPPYYALFRSDDAGSSWAVAEPGAYLVAGSSGLEQVLFTFKGYGQVFESLDGGTTWSEVGSIPGSSIQPSALAVSPSTATTVYAGTLNNGVFRSADGGRTWHQTSLGKGTPGITDFAIDPLNPNHVLASSDSATDSGPRTGLYETTDGGSSWSHIAAGLPATQSIHSLAFDSAIPEFAYAGSDQLYASSDGGHTWNSSSSGSHFFEALFADPFIPGRIYSGDAGVFAVSDDRGATWTSIFNRRGYSDLYGIAVANGGQFIYTAWADAVYAYHAIPAGPCVASASTLCLQGGRFSLAVTWKDQHVSPATTGVGTAIPDTGQTGFFWFFAPDSIELIVKIVDGTAVNGKFWVFYGALSDVEYTVTITDTQTGAIRAYHNAPGHICGGADTSAFDSAATFSVSALPAPIAPAQTLASGQIMGFAWERTPEPSAFPAPCSPGGLSLCLLSNRFRVSVDWTNQHASPATTGVGTAVASTDQTGYFWFFSADSLELAIKMIDGRALNGKFWVFYGALSDVEYTITVTDTQTGAVKTYHNDPGNICGGADTAAFSSS